MLPPGHKGEKATQGTILHMAGLIYFWHIPPIMGLGKNFFQFPRQLPTKLAPQPTRLSTSANKSVPQSWKPKVDHSPTSLLHLLFNSVHCHCFK